MSHRQVCLSVKTCNIRHITCTRAAGLMPNPANPSTATTGTKCVCDIHYKSMFATPDPQKCPQVGGTLKFVSEDIGLAPGFGTALDPQTILGTFWQPREPCHCRYYAVRCETCQAEVGLLDGEDQSARPCKSSHGICGPR